MKIDTRVRSLAYAVALISPIAANAQIEEVIVTAQKRSESIQDVPIAINAFTGDTLEKLGVIDASGLVNITPGLNSTSNSGSNRNYSLRGVGTVDYHLTAASAIGQYFDGVTLTSSFLAKAALFDMDRVEILKGPQNTLFGLNTTGGAINYISNKPEVGAGLNGDFTLRVGSDSLVNAEAAVGFDLGDTMAARLALQTNKYDSPFTSVTDGREYGDEDMYAYRAAFVWEPIEQVSFLLNIHGSETDANASAVRSTGTNAPDGSGNPCQELGSGPLDFEDNNNCITRDGGITGPATDPSTGDWEKSAQFGGIQEVETQGVYLKFDYEFESATFHSITSWDNLDFSMSDDADGSASLGFILYQEDDRDTLQQEFRLVSASDDAFRWIAGIYYLDEDAESYTGGRSPFWGAGAILPNVQLEHTKENLGVYFQGEYDLTDDFTLTAGVRWSDEEIKGDYLPSRPLVVGLPADAQLFQSEIDVLVRAQNPGTPEFDDNGYEIARQVSHEISNEDVGYTLKLDWRLTDESLAYLSYSRGFKGSALDTRVVFALVPVPLIEAGLKDELDPESLDAWELGYKGTFLDGHIQLDSAIFYYEYSDLQQFVVDAGVPRLDNAPESEIYGFDGNLMYANDTGFYLQAGLSILDAEVTDVGDSSFIEGAELASSPSYSFSLIASQDFEFDNGSVLSVLAGANYTGEHIKSTLTQGSNLTKEYITQESYTLVNANMAYRFGSNQQYVLSIFGDNLTDVQYCGQIGTTDGNGMFLPGNVYSGFSKAVVCRFSRDSTRTYGASFSIEF